MPTNPPDASAIGDRLRLGTGFHEADRQKVIDRLGALERHLASYSPDDVKVDVFVKERDGAAQQVTLECVLPGLSPTIAKSSHPELSSALVEAREELIRQLSDATGKRDPTHTRQRFKDL